MEYSLNQQNWRIMGLIPTEWKWRKVAEVDANLDQWASIAPSSYPAQVPGDVQSDLVDAGVLPNPWYEENSRNCEWTSSRDWVYRCEFVSDHTWKGRKIRLLFKGVDFSCHVYLNGVPLGDHAGMYDPFVFDVSESLKYGEPNQLIVVVNHAPWEPANQGQIGSTNEITLWKARFAYDWDWCTRLVPLGIWGDVSLLITGPQWIEDVWVRTNLNAALDKADINVQVSLNRESQGCRVEADILENDRIVSQMSTVVGSKDTQSLEASLSNPNLWHPNGNGEHPLYECQVRIVSPDGRISDEKTVRFGVRKVVAVPNDNAPSDALPYALEINGVKTFIKGWNWTPVDQLYGRPRVAQYRRMIQLAEAAHCNLLRVWGGGLLEKEIFYNLCDEAGIMVWQEFIQSSSGLNNEPSSSPDYLAYCRSQAEAMIPLRRNHPSLVIWCGGNELTDSQATPLGMDHPNISTLAEIVNRLDPDRIFLPTSPSGPFFAANPDLIGKMHDVHGPWNYQGNPNHYHLFNNIDPLLHSEFGVEGSANLQTIHRTIAKNHQYPPDADNPHWSFHAHWWSDRKSVEKVFGPFKTIEDYVKASQWIQYEGLRYAVESNRRRKWRTSGTIPWQYNEPWPNTVCTNCVDYFGKPKPVYYAVRNAYAPLLISAKYDRLSWAPGEEWSAEIWVNNSIPATKTVNVSYEVRTFPEKHVLTSLEGELEITPCSAMFWTMANHILPMDYSGFIELHLRAWDDTDEASENSYLFSVRDDMRNQDAPFASLLHMEYAKLSVSASLSPGRGLSLVNTSDHPALFVTLHQEEDYSNLLFASNYFHLGPHETRFVGVRGNGGIRVCGWNFQDVLTIL